MEIKHEDLPVLYAAAPKLLEGCEAALSALQDRTLSERRILENINFLKDAISTATETPPTDLYHPHEIT